MAITFVNPAAIATGGSSITGDIEVSNFDNVARITHIPDDVMQTANRMPPGEAGANGEDGMPGPPGPVGPGGSAGAQGPGGTPGMPGEPGIDGLDGFPGIPGPQGAQGNPGVDGAAGIPGIPGTDAIDGQDGIPGVAGATGATGATGAQGSAGVPGPPGEAGDQGDSGFPGIPGPQGTQGDPGPQGIPGMGIPGVDANDGLDGTPGATGAAGVDGATGAQGAAGVPGPPGEPGEQGESGFPGIPGSQGAQGDPGPQGIPGMGIPGMDANDGIDGIPGLVGAAGIDGATGAQGAAGVPGPPGETGDQGDSGFPGIPGPQGAAGANGANGLQGLTGPPGLDGIDAEPCFVGPWPWVATLSAGNRTGGNNVYWDVGTFANFGLDGPTTSNPQIRSGDATFRMRGAGNVAIFADGGVVQLSASTDVNVVAANAFTVVTNLVTRLTVASTGEWFLAGLSSTAGQVIASQGPGLPPIWTTPSATGGGTAGPPGVDGKDGEDGAPGVPGATGPAGATGATGATGPAGVSGAIMALATVNFGTSAQSSGTFQITGLSGLVVNTPVEVSMAVDTTDPTESENNCTITGIATSSSVITCYWDAHRGSMQGTRKVQYLIAAAASNLTLSEGQFVGLPITHAGPGTNGPAVPLDGSFIGENIRWSTQATNLTAAGDIGTTAIVIEEPGNVVFFNGTSPLVVSAISIPGVGSGTAIAAEGRMILARVAAGQGAVHFIHENTAVATTAQRLSCPGNSDYTAYPGEYILIHRVVYGGTTTRTRIMPLGQIRTGPAGPNTMRHDSQEFVGATGASGANTVGGLAMVMNPEWHFIANANVHGSVFSTNASGVVASHFGVVTARTGTTTSDWMSIFRDGTILTGGAVQASWLDFDKIARAEFWIRIPTTVATKRVVVGFTTNVTAPVFSSADNFGFYYDSGQSANWQVYSEASAAVTTLVTTVAATANNWYKLALQKVARLGILFFINDNYVGLITSNIPGGGPTSVYGLQVQTLAASATDVDMDRADLWILNSDQYT